MSSSTGRFVYIAGRYGDGDGYLKIEDRIQRARWHAKRLAQAGIPFYSPHLNCAHFEVIAPGLPLSFWQEQDECFLLRSTAVLVILEEFGDSFGAQGEAEVARMARIPVYFTPEIDFLISHWPPNKTLEIQPLYKGETRGRS